MKSRQIDADAVYHVQKNFFFLNSRLLNEKLRKQEKKIPKIYTVLNYPASFITHRQSWLILTMLPL